MQIDVIEDAESWADHPLETWADQAVHAVCDHLKLDDDCSLAILACDDARIASLNADFRGKSKPTNVLSWPSNEFSTDAPHTPVDLELGDIAIAYETCSREAGAQGKRFKDHVIHLLVHATLHLLGYDHISDAEAMIMEGIEVEILAKLSISNPYIVSDQ